MSNGDPIGSDAPKGKSNAQRKGRYDGSYTGTEQRVKDQLMKQFCRDEGPPPSEAYRNAPCWCACGRLKADGNDECAKCIESRFRNPGDWKAKLSADTARVDKPAFNTIGDGRACCEERAVSLRHGVGCINHEECVEDSRVCDCGRGHHRDRHEMEAHDAD